MEQELLDIERNYPAKQMTLIPLPPILFPRVPKPRNLEHLEERTEGGKSEKEEEIKFVIDAIRIN